MISRLVLKQGEQAYPRRHQILFTGIDQGAQWLHPYSSFSLQTLRKNIYSWIFLLNRLILVDESELTYIFQSSPHGSSR